MISLALNVLGRLVALTPEPALRMGCAVAGEMMLWLAPRRSRLLRSNLHHAFPERSRSWRRSVARDSSRALVETALLSLASPYFSMDRLRRIATVSKSAQDLGRDHAATPRAAVFGVPHLALWETLSWFTGLADPVQKFAIVYRPLGNPALDGMVKASRERHGMRLLSRRQGFAEAMAFLRGGGSVGILFDQNAGTGGALSLLLGRVCSTTELPGILAEKFGAELWVFYPRRTAFWRVTFETERLDYDGTAAGATVALNLWLESALQDEALCRSWLWAHDRWRNQDVPGTRLRLAARRSVVADDLRARGLAALPRKTRLWIRMPNWLGDAVMVLPFLRAIRASRPDAELTLLAREAFCPFLESLGVADSVRPLPPKGAGYLPAFARCRADYPDAWILFTNSARGDLEARIAGCPQRFGILRPGGSRPLLTHAFAVPTGFDEAHHHQVELWENFLKHFGLGVPLDLSPFGSAREGGLRGPIGLIPGSENEPRKRWPVERWRELAAALPGENFILFGTAGDAPITRAVAEAIGTRAEDLAGRTGLGAFAARLQDCRLLVANDTGGMHLANALGVPVVALFGPTNPVRTGPVFASPHRILQPPGCPPTGGGDLALLGADAVAAAVRDLP